MGTAVIGAPEWRASSGRIVRAHEDGSVSFGLRRGYIAPDEVMDAAEFFRAQQDIELGRWRYPADPEWLVREIGPDGFGRRRVQVLNERTFEMTVFNPNVTTGESAKHRAAREFFAEHPERKPWEKAEVDHIWALTFEAGGTSPWVRTEVGWHLPGNRDAILHGSFTITDGRRIWPEDAS